MSEVDKLIAEANQDPTKMSVLRFGDNAESIKEGTGSMAVSSIETMKQGSLPKSSSYTSVEDVASK